MIGDESPPPVIIGSLIVVPSCIIFEVTIPTVTPGTDEVRALSPPLVEGTNVEDVKLDGLLD